ncbi:MULTISPECIES: putative capsular polysaccharide synthesis family protein [Isoptericola]|uniref:putative capsular polysaccharide synthesis family protein n=1 Tax=Isoptericola TaxID=254250 RepID=UPI000D05E689|nr:MULTISPECIES: putative capsular polysaccharide synthesis family protein [Isoptericola]MCK0116292.1 putative capsular polysaccharide synthesis family protein [Isoptericola sp. S6320L]
MIVLVLTMGRVGSSATHRALAELSDAKAFHIHHIARDSLNALRRPDGQSARHVQDGLMVREILEAEPDRPVKIISLVRDVVARNLSVGFARLRRLGDGPDELRALCRDSSLTSRIWRNVDFRAPLSWFDHEIGSQFGIDVFQGEFDGSATFTHGRSELIVLRSDLDNASKSNALTSFLGSRVEVGQMSTATQDGGELRSVYDEFARTVPWSGRDLREMAESRVMQHFFSVTADAYVEEWAHKLGIS